MSYRLTIVIALFVASAILLTAERQLPAAAGDKKTEAKLQAEVSQLQGQITQLQTTNTQLNNQLQSTTKNANDAVKSLQSTIDGYRGAGIIHVVLLKAKPDATKTETPKPDTPTTDTKSPSKTDAKTDPKSPTQKLIDDAYSQLAKIKGVRGLWAGKPSTKGTPDGNTDYSVALVLMFDDAAALKAYLNDSAHTKFADKHLKNFETPVVYDLEPRKPQP